MTVELALYFSIPDVGNSHPVYGFLICCGFFVYGLFSRGPRSVTNWLLLIPAVMWGVTAFYSVARNDAEGLWGMALILVSGAVAFCWVAIEVDRQMRDLS